MRYILTIMAMIASVYAVDFEHMSTENMMNMRGSVSVDERPAFQQEMQKRMQSMSPEERQKYMQTKGMKQGKGMMNQGQGMKSNQDQNMMMNKSKGMMNDQSKDMNQSKGMMSQGQGMKSNQDQNIMMNKGKGMMNNTVK
ncbi:MAG: hypothetical protein B7Y23_10070 [Sulfurovum sp. 16-42-52]|jgi:hypothetical protein|nr:MAG: hypothetical protein B7Y23_10070 [Sulfurovum sp. 16-42-52]OYZ39907.1 MAG: hypothetical protein B7Y18_03205 [Thiotrichales bacterium 24-47-4]